MDWRTVAIVLGSVLVVWAILIGLLWILRPRDVGLRELLRVIPDVLRLVRRLLGDRAIPLRVKVALVVLLAWLISPIDLIPEFIPVVGPLDDIVIAAIVLRWVGRRVGEDTLRAHWPGSPEGFGLVLRLLGHST